jgi:hypothetical protein
LILWLTDRVAGVSTILGQIFSTEEGELNWRPNYIQVGLVFGIRLSVYHCA